MSEPTLSQAVADPTASPGASTHAPENQTVRNSPLPAGFELFDEVGRGGMGIVYRARDLSLDREVAVKILQDQYSPSSGAARRFVEEARITAQLQHPGIPAVYQVGTLADGRPFLAMKLIKGETLDALLKAQAPIDPLAVFEAIAQAVGFAHAHGVIHRDLKPANVMVGAFGEVQVMDWGLAKVLAASREKERSTVASDTAATLAPTEIRSLRESDGSFTQAGSVLGTPAFMPPEQAAGELERIDTRSDVFGLGAILCVLLTGKPPFDGKDPESVRINAVRGKTDEALARLDACGADLDVIALCKRCLALDPAERPATANEVATQVTMLRRVADDRARLAEREKHAAEVQATEQVRRRRVLQWAAVAVIWVLVGGIVASLWQAKRAMRAETEALLKQREAENARQAESDERGRALAAAAAEKQAKEVALAKEAEANAVVKFFDDRILAAARPKGQEGGLGKDVSLRDAIAASLPTLATGFKEQPLVEARLRRTLGNTFYFLGDYSAASDQYERVWAIFLKQLGPDNPDTLQIALNRANIYQVMGRGPEAIKLYEETLATQRRLLPRDDPDTLMTIGNLAVSYTNANRHQEALKLRVEALEAYTRVRGPDHESTLGCKINMAVTLDALGRHVDALKLREETFADCKRVLSADHPYTLLCMHNLAMSYETLHRDVDAMKLREQTVAAQKRVLPPDHPDTLLSMQNLSYSYFSLGRHQDGLKLREETLAARKRVLPPDHPDTLRSKLFVAESLIKVDRGAEAIPLIDEYVFKSPGKIGNTQRVLTALRLRLRHFEKANDPAGCRATVVMWEDLNRTDAESLYCAACYRAIASGLYARASQAAEATADADLAMKWLTKASDAGFRDRALMDADTDLTTLRRRADFQKLIASLPYIAPLPRPVPKR